MVHSTTVHTQYTHNTHRYLHYNEIHYIPASLFDNLAALTELYLYGNRLKVIEQDTFSGTKALSYLMIGDQNNALATLPYQVFEGLNNLNYLYISQNTKYSTCIWGSTRTEPPGLLTPLTYAPEAQCVPVAPTVTATPTVTPTVSLTPSTSPSNSASPTHTPDSRSPTPTPTPTTTPSGSVSRSGTPALSESPTLSHSPTTSLTPSMTPTPSPTAPGACASNPCAPDEVCTGTGTKTFACGQSTWVRTTVADTSVRKAGVGMATMGADYYSVYFRESGDGYTFLTSSATAVADVTGLTAATTGTEPAAVVTSGDTVFYLLRLDALLRVYQLTGAGVFAQVGNDISSVGGVQYFDLAIRSGSSHGFALLVVYSQDNTVQARSYDPVSDTWLSSPFQTGTGPVRYCKGVYDESSPVWGYLVTDATVPESPTASWPLVVARHEGGGVSTIYTASNVGQFALSRDEVQADGSVPYIYIAHSDTVAMVIQVQRRPTGSATNATQVSCGPISTTNSVYDLRMGVANGLIYIAYYDSTDEVLSVTTCATDNTNSAWRLVGSPYYGAYDRTSWAFDVWRDAQTDRARRRQVVTFTTDAVPLITTIEADESITVAELRTAVVSLSPTPSPTPSPSPTPTTTLSVNGSATGSPAPSSTSAASASPSPSPSVDLSNNNIQLLSSATFNLATLNDLDLSQNSLTDLQNGVFSGLSEIQKLSLSLNTITLQSTFLSDLNTLQEFSCAECGFTQMDVRQFESNPNLQKLDMSANEITSLSSGTFDLNLGLQNLDLSANRLSTVPANLFANNVELLNLDMSFNEITFLDSTTFLTNTKLLNLFLQLDGVFELPPNIFTNLAELQVLTIDFAKLPLTRCIWGSTGLPPISYQREAFSYDTAVCTSPSATPSSSFSPTPSTTFSPTPTPSVSPSMSPFASANPDPDPETPTPTPSPTPSPSPMGSPLP
ncbi:hypothetical protein SARC_01183 [Sphaeroforma arctica JP610]|uniref:Uncharacterized protein n=1 Tax=Sphaeroforma arctica JP610 TaxID=667725 RepID=A0A0L0GCE3_9EUKA|nr:hypothetical protein SARC_01183 [Sphaeroforma arctica JP610]KNC86677.1 hypothetical protein SARC_01183 [Sphaeroforma arctica JP610]|eukprot:XP_014160579.1 hypothetical protein SARC_01183 [Sphaeroforma arctica JP610]